MRRTERRKVNVLEMKCLRNINGVSRIETLKHLLAQFVNRIQSNLSTEYIQNEFIFLKDCTSLPNCKL